MGRGSAGEGWPEGCNGGVNGFNAIEDGGRLRTGLRGGGMMAGRVTARAASEGGAGRCGVAGGDEEKQQRSAGLGKGMLLIGGPHMAVT
jgi:hypothetical protein